MGYERTGTERAERTAISNELSGTVIGPSVQAGVIHGGVHFHETPHGPPLIPRQLPAPPPHFTNRADELAQLDELCRNGSTLVVLTGPGGVGKTALVTRWAQSAQDRFPDGQLYVDLGGFSGDEPVDPGEALNRFLRALGVAPQRVPVALSEQAALYRSVTAGRSLLVVLDNAYSAAQVRVLVPASAMTVMTSRSRLVGLVPDGARLIEVAPLPTDDALALLTQAVGPARIARERERAEDLAGMCGGLPIALCVTAARLAARPRLSLGRMASELADEASRLGGLSALGGPSVQATFDMSYRCLGESAAALYRRLALHPGQEFGPGPVAALAPSIDAQASPQAHVDAVDPLLEASLLQEVDEDRFRFHDLLRLHARQKAETDDSQHDRDAALRAMLEWYLAAAIRADMVVTPYRRRLPYPFATRPGDLPVLSGRDEALSWLERERVNLIAAGRAAFDHEDAELAWHLSDVLWPLFLYRKHYRDRMEVDRRGVAAARAWGNVWAEADMLKRLGRVCTTAGDYEAAEQHIREAIVRYGQAGDARGGVDAQEGLAALYRDSHRPQLAADMFAQTLAANRELGEDRNTGLTLISLGMLLPALGRSDEAVGLLRQAQELFATLSDIDPYNKARVLIGLAAGYLGSGDLPDAERAATEAAQRMRDLGSDHEHAEALDLLGQIAHRRGAIDTAQHHYRRALDIFDIVGSARAAAVRHRLADLRATTDAANPRSRGGVPAADMDP